MSIRPREPGGKKGPLVVTSRGLNICTKKQIGNASFGAQSGMTTSKNMTLSTPCTRSAKAQARSKKRRSGVEVAGQDAGHQNAHGESGELILARRGDLVVAARWMPPPQATTHSPDGLARQRTRG